MQPKGGSESSNPNSTGSHPRHTTILPPPPRSKSNASVQPKLGHRLQHYQPCVQGASNPMHNNRVCSTWGKYHIKMFDGEVYQFPGTCNYVLTSQCGSAYEDFNIQMRRTIVNNQPWISHVTMKLDGTVVELSNGTISVNSKPISPPYSQLGVQIEESSLYIKVTAKSGVMVMWNGEDALMVEMPEKYMNETCGLCGDFNGIENNDGFYVNGLKMSPTDFGNFQKMDGPKETCEDVVPPPVSNKTQNMQLLCEQILSSPVFAGCNALVSIDPFVQACAKDMVDCVKDKNSSCLCYTVSEYTRQCTHAANFTVFMPSTFHMIIDTSFGVQLQIQLIPLMQVYVTLDASFKSQTCGICGNFNNVQADDFNTNSGVVEGTASAFANTWKTMATCSDVVDNYEDPCSQSVENVNYSTSCPETMTYSYSMTSCGRTCRSLSEPDPTCNVQFVPVDGCGCKEGSYMDDSGKCVPKSNCPCYSKGVLVKAGEVITKNGVMCTCNERKWNCTNQQCYGSCVIRGEGHYLTFDGKRFSFNGNCEYTIVQDYCGINPDKGTFRVITENIPCGSTGTTCSKAIKLFLGQDEIRLSDGQYEVIKRDISIDLPYKISHMGMYLVMEIKPGLILMWDKKTSVHIKLSPLFKGNVCGLCGNFDGNANNDFTTSSQSVVVKALEFGNSWKVSPSCPDAKVPKDPCLSNPYRQSWAQKQCSIIKSKVFAACHRQVDPTPYYDACVYDSCACDSGGDCECFCTSVAAYAAACNEANVCISWRRPDICPSSGLPLSTKSQPTTICEEEICEWSIWYDIDKPDLGDQEGDFETFENIKKKGYTVCQTPTSVECRAHRYPDTPLIGGILARLIGGTFPGWEAVIAEGERKTAYWSKMFLRYPGWQYTSGMSSIWTSSVLHGSCSSGEQLCWGPLVLEGGAVGVKLHCQGEVPSDPEVIPDGNLVAAEVLPGKLHLGKERNNTCLGRNTGKKEIILFVEDTCKKLNETWNIDKCTLATCKGNNEIQTVGVKCKPVKEMTCANGRPARKVYDDSGCCYDYECECVCEVVNVLHHVTFDGTSYIYRGNCTYVLVQQINNKYDDFRIYINEQQQKLERDIGSQSLWIFYKSNSVYLTREQNINKPGATVPSSICEECKCSSEIDADTKLFKIDCNTKKCDKNCHAGFTYQDVVGQCCGRCVQIACIFPMPSSANNPGSTNGKPKNNNDNSNDSNNYPNDNNSNPNSESSNPNGGNKDNPNGNTNHPTGNNSNPSSKNSTKNDNKPDDNDNNHDGRPKENNNSNDNSGNPKGTFDNPKSNNNSANGNDNRPTGNTTSPKSKNTTKNDDRNTEGNNINQETKSKENDDNPNDNNGNHKGINDSPNGHNNNSNPIYNNPNNNNEKPDENNKHPTGNNSRPIDTETSNSSMLYVLMPKQCKVHKNTTYITHEGCQSLNPVAVSSCEGACNTYSMYSSEANAMEHKCSCCQELQTSFKNTTLKCSNGTIFSYSYIYVEECSCRDTRCEAKDHFWSGVTASITEEEKKNDRKTEGQQNNNQTDKGKLKDKDSTAVTKKATQNT
ncbi:MUC5B protein, partial [Polypterus senegalus]